MLRDFFLGFIKIHILHHAGREEVYGAALIEELARHGYEVSPVRKSIEPFAYLKAMRREILSVPSITRGYNKEKFLKSEKTHC